MILSHRRRQLVQHSRFQLQVSAGPEAPDRRQVGVADAVRHRVGTRRQQQPDQAAVWRRRPEMRRDQLHSDQHAGDRDPHAADDVVAPAGRQAGAAAAAAAAAAGRLRVHPHEAAERQASVCRFVSEKLLLVKHAHTERKLEVHLKISARAAMNRFG